MAESRGKLSDEGDPYGVRNMSNTELENIALGSGAVPQERIVGAARAELDRRQRVHERDAADRHMQAANRQLAVGSETAKAARLAAIAAWGAAIAAVASALGTIAQAVIAWWK